jgi:hypothetical protein
MGPSRRLVLFEPGLASGVGHHRDVSSLLLPPLLKRGWNVEIWADAAAGSDPLLAASLPGLRPLLRDGGYIDPRHWCDLPGNLHQARLLHQQLDGAASGERVAVWLAHSLVPFQLIALAQLLQRQAPARVVISLMFAPGEVFAGQPELDLGAQRLAAQLNARSALAALALAVERGNHQLLLCAGSHQLIALYTPLCLAAGLAPPQLHPSVVAGDGASFDGDALDTKPIDGGGAIPQILLHWGDRKPDKGRELSLSLLEHLLSAPELPPALARAQWCFHASSHHPPSAREAELLLRAGRNQRLRALEGPIPRHQMLQELARSDVALLPYCPIAYAERSSGVLWLYGSARLARQQPARVVGHPGGWLAAEAQALAMTWQPLPPNPSAQQAFDRLAQVLQAPASFAPPSAYGQQVLGNNFANWLVQRLDAHNLW